LPEELGEHKLDVATAAYEFLGKPVKTISNTIEVEVIEEPEPEPVIEEPEPEPQDPITEEPAQEEEETGIWASIKRLFRTIGSTFRGE